MKILLLYPRYPDSFWSMKYAARFIDKRAAYPPLGLLTVASLIPGDWEKKLVDLNVQNSVEDEELKWADYVFISAMDIQKDSTREIIDRCKSLGIKIVAGGPMFTSSPEEYTEVDHLILDEAEISFPQFLADLEKGVPRHIYRAENRPNLSLTPIPDWDLINMEDYVSMNVQFSRGCPYDCEFCDITYLYGRKPRLKPLDKFIMELEALYHKGWRGSVFIVDDNFIGNKGKLKKEILPALIDWMNKHEHPFSFITEASINLAEDDKLLSMMRDSGFQHVFVGIETPSEESLQECNKFLNISKDLIACVKKIQNYGMQVSGGFIVGFDSDTPSIFERQIKFIQESGIVIAMVSLLNAPRGTKLFHRLKNENRLLPDFSGNNTDFSINFVPKMDMQELLEGYRSVVANIYDPSLYYQRITEFFKEFKPAKTPINTGILTTYYIKAFFKAMFYLGIIEKGRRHYWKLLLKTLFKYPRFLPQAITFAVYGFHFRKIFEKNIKNVEINLNKDYLDSPSYH